MGYYQDTYSNQPPKRELKPVETEQKQQYEPVPYGSNVSPDSKTLTPNNHVYEKIKENAPKVIKAAGEAINENTSDEVVKEITESTEKMADTYKNAYERLSKTVRGGNDDDDGNRDDGDDGQPELEFEYKKKKPNRDGPEL